MNKLRILGNIGTDVWNDLVRLQYLSAELKDACKSLCFCAGVGALYVRRRPRVRLEPLQNGGGQERGLRSGTVPTPLAVGLGAACGIAHMEMEVNGAYVKIVKGCE